MELSSQLTSGLFSGGLSLLFLGVILLTHPAVAPSVCWLVFSLKVAEPRSLSYELLKESSPLLMPLAF